MKYLMKISLSAAGVFIVFVGLILFINSYNYNNVYVPDHLRIRNETENELRDNKSCFETAAGSFADKYGELTALNDNEADTGEIYYYPSHDFLRVDFGEYATSIIKAETDVPKQKKYTFTQEQIDAMKYILSELNYAAIRYSLLKDGSYYVYFCKEGILKKPFFAVTNNMIPDNAYDFGIVYSSSDKTTPIHSQQLVRTDGEYISSSGWCSAYSVQ